MNLGEDAPKTPIGEPIKTSCERCRRRKIKCDRNQPCAKCAKANTQCVRGTGEKQRPVSKSYVQALEAQVASLELFIHKVAASTPEQRNELLESYVKTHGIPESPFSTPLAPDSPATGSATPAVEGEVILARPRTGHLRKLRTSNTSHFYGGTSLYQLNVSDDLAALTLEDPKNDSSSSGSGICIGIGIGISSSSSSSSISISNNSNNSSSSSSDVAMTPPVTTCFQYSPQDSTSQNMISAFFRMIYPYNMMVYREYFLRDYDTSSGPYYSEILLYSICALGALVTDDPMATAISRVYASQAQTLLFNSLDSPNLCMLQALLLLGYREIGQDNPSKGWLFCGMAFRLAHEMGLHLDPNNWGSQSEASVDREILRRVYWATFIVDKQLSLYFGRPPALYPQESDVRNTIRIPYPPDWQSLLDLYISEDTSAKAYEDGIALVGSFIYQAELAKITHTIITDIFENRRSSSDNTIAATKARQAHASLIKWLSGLPGKLHWNQWTVGQIPPEVLHLHMAFHTLMIILHRPPQQLFDKPGIATGEDVEICYQSLQVLFRLMRSYARYYDYRCLPLDFVHTLSTAAGTVLMKRHFEKAPWDDTEVTKNLTFLIDAMEAIRVTWPCVRKIQEIVIAARANPNTQDGITLENQLLFTDLMNGLVDMSDVSLTIPGTEILHMPTATPSLSLSSSAMGFSQMSAPEMMHTSMVADSLGALVTDDVLGGNFAWEYPGADISSWFVDELPSGR